MIFKYAKLNFFDGQTAVHIISPFQYDVSLCGHDLSGDSGIAATGGGYEEATLTDEKCDCPDCFNIVKYCKSLSISKDFINLNHIE